MSKKFKIEIDLVHQNNHIDIVHDACKLCYHGKPEPTIERKLKYIEDKVRLGHESVIEHSNLIMVIQIDGEDTRSLIEMCEILSASKYLNCNTQRHNDTVYYLLSGNIRAFKNIYRNMDNQDNHLSKLILNELYHTPKEYYYDFIKAGIMSSRSFDDTIIILDNLKSTSIKPIDDHTIITGIDDIYFMYHKINDLLDHKGIFSIDNLLDACSVTVFFKDIARILSQQITRHRNGVSQQSQRYVDEGKAEGVNPLSFTDYISKDAVFDVSGIDKKLTLDELNVYLLNIYNELRQQGLKKEDARYFLPQSVYTSLYMTFTLRSLIHFIDIRTDKAAQHEVRGYANILNTYIKEEFSFLLGEDLSKYLLPKYMLTELETGLHEYNIDELLVEPEEV